MVRRSFAFCRVAGFELRIHASWIVVAVLVTWTLASLPFAARHPGLGTPALWAMGAVTALGFFACILLHELAHSVVARRHGIPVRGITLFIFGGVAHVEREPPTPASEFFMAIAGPIASALLAVGFWVAADVSQHLPLPGPITTITGELGRLNVMLAVFNMIPAFPLDGGRVLRAVLWGWRGDVAWATRWASGAGVAFGGVLVAGGVAILAGLRSPFGVWWVLIGGFLVSAARAPVKQLAVRRALEGRPVSALVRCVPPVQRATPIRELVESHVLRRPLPAYPVVDGDELLGLVRLDRVAALPREDWEHRSVGELTEPRDATNCVAASADTLQAITQLGASGLPLLLVVDGPRLAGVVLVEDLVAEIERTGRGRREVVAPGAGS